MNKHVTIWDYVVFGSLLILSGVAGLIYAYVKRKKGAQTAESYFAGDRGLSVIPTAFSLFGSLMSAVALVGMPAELYVAGGKFFMHTVGSTIGIIIGAFLLVPTFYRLQLISSLEYLELRYGSKRFRIACSIMTLLNHILAVAVVTYAPCMALEMVTGIPIWAGVLATGSITMLYTVLGGVKAVVMVDLIQGVIVLFAVIMALVVGFQKIPGGIERGVEVARLGGRLEFFDLNPDPRNTYSIYAMLLPQILFTAKSHTSGQSALQKYSALPTVKKAVIAVLIIAPLMLVVKVLLLLFSWAMFAYYQLKGCDPLRGKIIANPNELTTLYITEIDAFPGFIGIWFAGLFAGSISTMSTAYNSNAAIIWEDMLKKPLEKRLSAKGNAIVMKLVTSGVGLLTWAFAIIFSYYKGNIVQLAIGTTTIFGTSTAIAFLAGCFLPFVNKPGAMAGMATGTLIAIFFVIGQFLGPYYGIRIDRSWLPSRTDQCQANLAGRNLNCSDTILHPEMIQTLFQAGITNWPKPCPQTTTPMTLVLANHPANVGIQPLVTVNNNYGLPDFLVYLYSCSVFLFPIFSAGTGMIVACLVSLCTGGIRQAKYVDPRYLIFRNCFSKAKDKKEDDATFGEPQTSKKGLENSAYDEEKQTNQVSWYKPARPPSPRFGHSNKRQPEAQPQKLVKWFDDE